MVELTLVATIRRKQPQYLDEWAYYHEDGRLKRASAATWPLLCNVEDCGPKLGSLEADAKRHCKEVLHMRPIAVSTDVVSQIRLVA
jgi:hypothetical protein